MSATVPLSSAVAPVETIRAPLHGVSIRPLREHELSEADRIFRLAFGTFIGLPDPMTFFEGANLFGSAGRQILLARWGRNWTAGFWAPIS